MEKAAYSIRKGNPFAVGVAVGEALKAQRLKKTSYLEKLEQPIDQQTLDATLHLFNRYCRHILEEVKGFSDCFDIDWQKNFFLYYSFLQPGCSQLAIRKSADYQGPSALIRNYDFDLGTEDFAVVNYQIESRYRFVGTSMMTFGVDSGINEHGLAVSMSACGPPVGVFKKPQTTGLRFWIAIRLLLETCQTAEEARNMLDALPLGDNVSYVCLDRSDNMLLYQTIDGIRDARIITKQENEYSLHVTNHPVLTKTIQTFPFAAHNSLVRYLLLTDYLSAPKAKNLTEIKTIYTTPYPQGLYCTFYADYFGTTKTVILYPDECKLEICWCGYEKNGWRTYAVDAADLEESYNVEYEEGKTPESMFRLEELE